MSAGTWTTQEAAIHAEIPIHKVRRALAAGVIPGAVKESTTGRQRWALPASPETVEALCDYAQRAVYSVFNRAVIHPGAARATTDPGGDPGNTGNSQGDNPPGPVEAARDPGDSQGDNEAGLFGGILGSKKKTEIAGDPGPWGEYETAGPGDPGNDGSGVPPGDPGETALNEEINRASNEAAAQIIVRLLAMFPALEIEGPRVSLAEAWAYSFISLLESYGLTLGGIASPWTPFLLCSVPLFAPLAKRGAPNRDSGGERSGENNTPAGDPSPTGQGYRVTE